MLTLRGTLCLPREVFYTPFAPPVAALKMFTALMLAGFALSAIQLACVIGRTQGLTATLYVLGDPVLAFDYDRDGAITDAEAAIARTGARTFRFWVNDDNDSVLSWRCIS